VFAQRFDSAGTRRGIEFQVNTYTSNSQDRPVVGAAANGDFVVAWESRDQDAPNPTGDLGIFGQRFSSAGVKQGAEFQVNVYFTNYQRRPRIAVNPSGNFVVTWESRFEDGNYEGVFARRFSPTGGAIGGEFQVNSYTFSGQKHQSIDWDNDGDFVIAWYSEPAQDGNAYGVFAQRFALPPLATLDVDGNGVLGALTDGLLILRKLFGFTGDTLITGAVGANCTRCDAASISSYITGLGLTLDIDNNGSLGALTDGLLCLRFLFGFTGTTLTSGAVAMNCVTRCDASTILPYLQTLD
jgi:hypothetical protein